MVHADGGEQAERDLRPLREWGSPIVDGVGPVPYVEIQQVLEQGWPPKKRFYEKSGYLSSMEDAFIEEMVACLDRAPVTNEGTGAKPLLSAMPMGGAIDRVANDAMAFSRRRLCVLVGRRGDVGKRKERRGIHLVEPRGV